MKKQLNSDSLILCGKIKDIIDKINFYTWLYHNYTVKEMLDEMNSVE